MRVGVSMAQLASPRTTGLERYSVEVLRVLVTEPVPGVEIVPYLPAWAAERLGVTGRTAPAGLPRPLVNEVWLAGQAARDRVDLLHELAFAPPTALLGRATMTLHDLVPWSLPETRSTGSRFYFTPAMTRALHSPRLRGLATDAACTLEEVRRRFGTTAPGVVAPLGAGISGVEGPTATPGPPVRLLTVGTLEPRKGLDVVQRMVTALQERQVDFRWRLVGRQGWSTDAPEGVEVLGAVDDAALLREYQEAHVLVAPSLDEGFDLPVLEALSCGLRVVASDIPVHREHYGPVVQLVPVGDAEATLAAVLDAAADPLAGALQRMAHAQGFTWQRTAAALHDLWRQAKGTPR